MELNRKDIGEAAALKTSCPMISDSDALAIDSVEKTEQVRVSVLECYWEEKKSMLGIITILVTKIPQ